MQQYTGRNKQLEKNLEATVANFVWQLNTKFEIIVYVSVLLLPNDI